MNHNSSISTLSPIIALILIMLSSCNSTEQKMPPKKVSIDGFSYGFVLQGSEGTSSSTVVSIDRRYSAANDTIYVARYSNGTEDSFEKKVVSPVDITLFADLLAQDIQKRASNPNSNQSKISDGLGILIFRKSKNEELSVRFNITTTVKEQSQELDSLITILNKRGIDIKY